MLLQTPKHVRRQTWISSYIHDGLVSINVIVCQLIWVCEGICFVFIAFVTLRFRRVRLLIFILVCFATMMCVVVGGGRYRGRHHLCAFPPGFWQLNSMAHSTAKGKYSTTEKKKRNVYIVNNDYHPSKFRGAFCERALEAFGKNKKKHWHNRNEKRWERLIRRDNTNMIKPSCAECAAAYQ